MKRLLIASPAQLHLALLHLPKKLTWLLSVRAAPECLLLLQQPKQARKSLCLKKCQLSAATPIVQKEGMNAARTLQQLENGITHDSAMTMSLDAQKGGHYLNNPELTLALGENAKEAEA